jgi:glycosyltransferase involved in cell wall biosynthesis
MDKKKINVYIASSVGIDYFFFLNKTISESGFNARPIFLIREEEYRRLAKRRGVLKVFLRIKMYVVYPFILVYECLKSEKGSIFIVSSNTFFAPYLCQVFLKNRNGKVIHLIYDLFPDALEVAGSIRANTFMSKILGLITKETLKKCNSTVYLGDFLKEHTEKRWAESKRSHVIDISTDLTLYDSEFISLIKNEKIIVHYGGQLGHLHDADSIIESIKNIQRSDISNKVEFIFYVSGSQASFLKEALKEYPVKVRSAVSSQEWRNDIKNFHIGLVSLSPGGASVCLPSKTYGMMAGGLAIIAVCPEWSDLSKLVKTLDAGWVINNSKYCGISQIDFSDYLNEIKSYKCRDEIVTDFYLCLKSILNNRELLEEKRRNSYYGVRKNFNINSLSKKWEKVIMEID